MVDAVQIRDETGTVIDPTVKEKQMQQDTHWQEYLTAAGVIKAEAIGQVVILTDMLMSVLVDAGTRGLYIRQGGAAGTIIGFISSVGTGKGTSFVGHSFREGLEGAAYDGSNAGDLYLTSAGGAAAWLFTATGYMRDA